MNIRAFFNFLFACATDEEFTPENIIAAMKANGFKMNIVDEAVYTSAVFALRSVLLLRKVQLEPIFGKQHPEFGPGRVDTFNPYKMIQFASIYRGRYIPYEQLLGTSDFPSIWNQGIREDMELHWDGNNSSVRERNLSASFGAGATRDSVDLGAIARLENWLKKMPPPKYSTIGKINSDPNVIARGREVYMQYCHDCHDPKGKYVGQVVPWDEIRTSRWRLDSYTAEFAEQQLEYGRGYDWQWKNFKKTNGYANAPLDGLWARAPYLHNGSIPTIMALLTPEEERSQRPFFRGHGVIDTVNLGIKTDVKRAGNLPSFKFDVTVDGNSNRGHSGVRYGTELPPQKKVELIEFLKTL